MSLQQLLKSIVISVLLMQDANQVYGLSIKNKKEVLDDNELRQIVDFFNKKENITEKWNQTYDKDHIDNEFSVKYL